MFVVAGLAVSQVGCNRTKIADDKNEEVSAGDGKNYVIPAMQSEHQVRVEVSADEELMVVIAVADGEKTGDVLGKAEKSKSVKLEVKIPAGKEAIIQIRPDKKCMVKTSIRSM